ncbi:hypothetical protein ACB098_06G127500 [Castanea mollissima]
MFFGAFGLLLSQLPDIHSLRCVNALCTFSMIGSAATTIGVTIYDGGLVMFSFACCIIALLLELHTVSLFLSYWQLASCGYWAFGSEVQPYILSSLSFPEWTIVMANLFAVIQLSGCYQIYCRPTYAYFEEKMLSSKATDRFPLRKYFVRLIFTSIYMALITLIAAAVPFFGDFVSICGAVGFTALNFVFLSVVYLKVGRMPKDAKCRLSMQLLNLQ